MFRTATVLTRAHPRVAETTAGTLHRRRLSHLNCAQPDCHAAERRGSSTPTSAPGPPYTRTPFACAPTPSRCRETRPGASCTVRSDAARTERPVAHRARIVLGYGRAPARRCALPEPDARPLDDRSCMGRRASG